MISTISPILKFGYRRIERWIVPVLLLASGKPSRGLASYLRRFSQHRARLSMPGGTGYLRRTAIPRHTAVNGSLRSWLALVEYFRDLLLPRSSVWD
jgi:hypothetical protein